MQLKEKPYVNGIGENNPRVKYMKDYQHQWSENQTFQSLTNEEKNRVIRSNEIDILQLGNL